LTGQSRKRIAVLGSTGSIGQSTLDVVRHWPERFTVEALVAGRNLDALLAQVREFRPRVVGFADPDGPARFHESWRSEDGEPPMFVAGEDAARQIAEAGGLDVVVNGLVGSLGLVPTLAALEKGTTVALANKEPLVIAGELVMRAARERGGEVGRTAARGRAVELLPLDSELSAIHQCLRGNPERAVKRVVLTASGGPFRERPAHDFAAIRPEEALRHPVWDMGPKISVDSATLLNKGLEIIETHWYFDLPFDRIQVVVHPQSLVHSMVEFVDHSVLAQVSHPDMRLPIQYALTYPDRLPSPVEPLDLAEVGALTFEEADTSRFPCLGLARAAGEQGGTAPAVLNAANEVAVEAFLGGEISFTEIPRIIEECVAKCAGAPEPTLGNYLEADRVSRAMARELVAARRGSVSATRPNP
jgi:1-deoxy-D-xylulose-5-phosphate reductoisomerase